ncbi:TIGR03943 family putative permease subunit [Bacillus sp. 1P02SD]|uniref:TIGR03943 family putative permease subunit n=1 Tax=Bacillus sp. 1P02SD TaxID=3132264 RepID=UPI0039A04E44
MKFHFQQAVRAFILLAFSVMLFNMHFTGEITKYINPKYEGLSQLASIIFLILFLIQVTRIWTAKEEHHHHNHNCSDHTCTHDHGDTKFNAKKLVSYSIILFPLLTGFFLSPKTLDAAIASKKGGMEILTNYPKTNKKEKPNVQEEGSGNAGEEIVSIPEFDIHTPMKTEEYDNLIQLLEKSQTVKMDDHVFNAYYEEIHKDFRKYQGRTIELKGFVYKEEGFTQEQFVISRFLITHCVADASIIGFLTELPESSSIDIDTWIEVKGIIDITTYNGMELPIIKITEWKKTTEPDEPYIYPLTIQLI